MIKTYNTPEAFHFVDPPNVNSNCVHYKNTFTEEDLRRLLEALTQIRGKFMLTMFPLQMLQDYIDKYNWNKHLVERCITASKENRRRQVEWIVTNY